MKRIKVISSNPINDQSGISDFIGMEFDVVETWKNRNTTLEAGQIGVILKNDKDLNPNNQWSILNSGEYEVIS